MIAEKIMHRHCCFVLTHAVDAQAVLQHSIACNGFFCSCTCNLSACTQLTKLVALKLVAGRLCDGACSCRGCAVLTPTAVRLITHIPLLPELRTQAACVT